MKNNFEIYFVPGCTRNYSPPIIYFYTSLNSLENENKNQTIQFIQNLHYKFLQNNKSPMVYQDNVGNYSFLVLSKLSQNCLEIFRNILHLLGLNLKKKLNLFNERKK